MIMHQNPNAIQFDLIFDHLNIGTCSVKATVLILQGENTFSLFCIYSVFKGRDIWLFCNFGFRREKLEIYLLKMMKLDFSCHFVNSCKRFMILMKHGKKKLLSRTMIITQINSSPLPMLVNFLQDFYMVSSLNLLKSSNFS